jgi:rare lipoprotein A
MSKNLSFYNLGRCAILLYLVTCSISLLGQTAGDAAPDPVATEKNKKSTKSTRTLYGQASYYASKFEGRKTATGEIFKHSKMTAACNILPLGTWIRITNLRNGKSIVVKTNDRLHKKTRRLVDLTKTAAQKLGFVKAGLTRVKVEVLKSKP